MNRLKFSTATAFLALVLVLGLGSAARAETINTLTITSWNLTYQVGVTKNNVNMGLERGFESFVHLDFGNNNFQDVIGYCVDLDQNISSKTPYGGYVFTATSPSSLAKYQAAAWLLGHYDPFLNNQPQDLTVITALQIAIWEATYDTGTTGGYSLTGGNVKFNLSNLWSGYNNTNHTLADNITNLANSYLTALGAAQTNGLVGLTGLGFSGVAISGANQDLIVGNVNAVPEPGSMLLFGSAAGLLGWLRRRKGQAKQEPVA